MIKFLQAVLSQATLVPSFLAMTSLKHSQLWSSETLEAGAGVLADQAVKTEVEEERDAMRTELQDRLMCIHITRGCSYRAICC